MTEESIDVTPRRQPVQARSRERVDSILSHAAAIFHEVGVDATSMSAIARQSDMSLASLYRYFPNKTAIVKAIAEDHVSRMESALRERLETLELMDAVDVLIDQFYEFYRNEPAYSAIWSGVESMPELRELDVRELYSHARDMDARLKRECPRLPGDRRWTASLMLPRSAGTVLRLAATLPDKQARLMISELKCMARAYLVELVR
ncbi:TetR/AcrR family transcriptional regulator [Marinobacter panjinensis]|uniref:TetR/AcrR family transcriptional regulator n=1 Tax=Marinobacter panjinensis TaxID=2576384 RepID=A0A4U6R1G0_9GAMM|nr:TetR/AcrR family transcriptional regulator [Marinobacter panjinensis]MCR8914054.1 TetR family transcriptional regulator [Marinobacter panjinensis]TKV67320.1 TetR/AcrR family transcriptional regulator [Marinobacter panjinensis]